MTEQIHWPQPDEPARDELIALLKRAELPAISTYEDIADAILAAGWVDLERFRHDVTNTLGMFVVHEDGDPDLGYDRGIVDAMDVVNGTADDVHACARCGHAARQHPFPHCEWWIGEEVRTTEAEKIIAEGWVREESRREEIARLTDQLRSAVNEIERLADENEQLENRAATCTVEHGTPMPKHAPFELQGGDLHGFRFCQACRKTWPCGEQARKGDPEAHIQHGGAL